MRAFAFLYGIIFSIIGIIGFIPEAFADGLLAKVLNVNLWLNLAHLLTGVAGLAMGCTNKFLCSRYFQIIGSLYALLAILGFLYQEKTILGFIASSPSNTWFHVITAIAALVLGYGGQKQ